MFCERIALPFRPGLPRDKGTHMGGWICSEELRRTRSHSSAGRLRTASPMTCSVSSRNSSSISTGRPAATASSSLLLSRSAARLATPICAHQPNRPRLITRAQQCKSPYVHMLHCLPDALHWAWRLSVFLGGQGSAAGSRWQCAAGMRS